MAKLNGRDILLVGLKGDKGENAEVDKTLTKENEAADAKVVGDALNNKLDKVTSPDTADRVYAIDVDGNQVVKTVTTTPLRDTIPKYTENGTIQSYAPQDIYDCANKEYVDTVAGVKADAQATMDAINSKLDKFTVQGNAGDKVYVARYDGTQTTFFIGARPGYIAQYKAPTEMNAAPAASCSLPISTPQSDYAAANKKYVDDIADTKLDKTTQGGNYQIYGVNHDGTQRMYQTGSYCLAGRIPWYSAPGSDVQPDNPVTIRVSDPTGLYDAANKQYVDEQTKYYLHDVVLNVSNVNTGMTEYVIEMKILSRSNQKIYWDYFSARKFAVMSSKGTKYSSTGQAQETKYNEYFNADATGQYTYNGWTWTPGSHMMSIIDTVNEII